MEKELNKFMEKINIINKDFSKYADEEGNLFYVNTVKLLTSIEVMKLPKEEYKKALFEQRIDDLDYTDTTIKVPVPKNTITKRDEDKYTLVDKEMNAKVIYNASNQIGLHKSFTNKEEAFKFANSINNKIEEFIK